MGNKSRLSRFFLHSEPAERHSHMKRMHDISSTTTPTANGTDGREAHPEVWVAVYTKPNSERRAAELLAKEGLETFVPQQTVVRQWSDRKKKIQVMVIPMVIFVRINPRDIHTLRREPLVLKILSYPGTSTPAIIPDTQIENLTLMLREAEEPVTFVARKLQPSDAVRVVRGKLAGLEGTVERILDKKTKIVVSLGLLGGVEVAIDESDLEPIQL